MQRPAPPLATIAAALRRERERVGISLAELARRAGLAKSTLSQLEAGTGNPSIETLWSLGVALGVPFSRLVEPPRARGAGDPGRRGAAAAAPTQADFVGHAARRRVAARPAGHLRDRARAGQATRGRGAHPGQHRAHRGGRRAARAPGRPASRSSSAPGDYVTFPGDVPHHYEALEPGTWAVLVMEHR